MRQKPKTEVYIHETKTNTESVRGLLYILQQFSILYVIMAIKLQAPFFFFGVGSFPNPKQEHIYAVGNQLIIPFP